MGCVYLYYPIRSISLSLLVLTMPHVLEIPHHSMFHRLSDLKVVSELCSFVSDHDVADFLSSYLISFFHTQDWTTDNGRKDMLWEIGASVSYFDKLIEK